MTTTSRRQARNIALQTLYEVDTSSHLAEEVLQRNLDEPASENVNATAPVDAKVREYGSSLVEGVVANRDQLDLLIEHYAPSWPLDQMSSIDKNILRLAIFEILFDNRVPLKAAIN